MVGPMINAGFTEMLLGLLAILLLVAAIIDVRTFTQQAADLCRRHKVLLIADEIQTGFGRTGKKYCTDWDGVKPDMYVVGKALGGGFLPVSAVIGTKETLGLFRPGDHGSTFGGNAIAAAVSLASLELLADPKLTERSRELGEWSLAWLQKRLASNRLVTGIRGKGLFIAVEVDAGVGARVVVDRLMNLAVLSKDTHHTVVRLAPPLTIPKRLLTQALERLAQVLDELEQVAVF